MLSPICCDFAYVGTCIIKQKANLTNQGAWKVEGGLGVSSSPGKGRSAVMTGRNIKIDGEEKRTQGKDEVPIRGHQGSGNAKQPAPRRLLFSPPPHTLSLSFASFSLVYELQEARTPFVPPSTTHAHKGLIAHAPLPFQVRLPLFT